MSELKTKYYFINFVKEDDSWFCKNNKNGGELCEIQYYPYFKQWSVVQFNTQAVFSAGCLKDIANFLEQLNKGGGQ